KNQGGGSVGGSLTQFYLSTDALLSSNDILLDGSHIVPGLNAGDSSTGSTSVTIPAGLTPGSYYFFAKADNSNAVAETQENNNTLLKLVTVGPDLIVLSISTAPTARAGSVVNVTDM